MSRSINRRQLGKGLIAGAGLVATGPRALARIIPRECGRSTADGHGSHPGSGATLGSPEAITPVSSRLVAARLEALSAVLRVSEPPIVPPIASVRSRGTSLTLPSLRMRRYMASVCNSSRSTTADGNAPFA